MRIAVIHGQMDKGNTYHMTKLFLDALTDEETVIKEYFLPKDAPSFCVGCHNCILEGENQCPHADTIRPIVEEIEASNLIIIDSACHVMGMTGQMKTFLDHLSYRWMSHRPLADMFSKTGLVISASDGMGCRRVCRDLARNLIYMGVPRVYHFGRNLGPMTWEEVPERKKERLRKEVETIAGSVHDHIGNEAPGLKTYLMFSYMKFTQRSNTWNPRDKAHWKQTGWLSGKNPWDHLDK
ncbi:MAG TPA: NAD(P)H-dependent oxidoreductase [Clostridiaceae bacterium]|nr:NAD(P)H-dependent oxidoreductase [Clostridiaceae bacterium]